MPTPLSQFFQQYDIDPTVKTVKVNSYKIGSDIYERTEYVINGAGWTTLCGEFWYSRKESNWIYRPAFYNAYYPQPPRDWLLDNTPSIANLERYQLMPTPPFALPLHLEPGRVGNSATVVDDNGDNVCYGYLPAMQAIVAAVNRVAVLEAALGDLIDMVNDGAPLPASPAYLRDGDTIRIESGYADKFRAACALLAAALKD